MSVPVCVLRYLAGSEIGRWNNISTTPAIPWVNSSIGYRILVNGVYCYIHESQTTNPRFFTLPTSYYSSATGTDVRGNFLQETGYSASVNSNLTSDEIAVSVRSGAATSSSPKDIYLLNEIAYYHVVISSSSRYRFIEWRNGGTLINSNNPLSRTITSDLTLTAVCEQYKWMLTTAANNADYGVTRINIIDTPASSLFTTGSTPEIQAVPANGGAAYKFKKWLLGGVDFLDNTLNPKQITTGTADATYNAVFIQRFWTLNVTPNSDLFGTVATKVGGYPLESNTGLSVECNIPNHVELSATPSFGYRFVGWYAGGNLLSSSATFIYTMPEANTNITASFAEISKATLTLSKITDEVSPTPGEMASIALYNRGATLQATCPASSSSEGQSITSSLYIGSQYKLVTTTIDPFGFIKWYDGNDAEITTGGVYSVDGATLYITPTDTTAIAVKAKFAERNNCTFEMHASDSSVYEQSNPAETDGCSASVTTPPFVTSPENAWLSGQDITLLAVQGFGWELRAWIASDSSGTVIASKSKGDTGFGQSFSFFLPADAEGSITVTAISSYVLPADQFNVQCAYKSGSSLQQGSLEIKPCGDKYVTDENGASAYVDENAECEITAIPINGFKFVAWYSVDINNALTQASVNPVYTFTVTANAKYAAEFAQAAAEHLVVFEGGSENRTARWRGKTFVSNVPVNFSCSKVYADGYPVYVDVGIAQPPDSPHMAAFVLRSTAQSQNPFRLPIRRQEKYTMVGVDTSFPVSAFALATSMEELKNG